MKTLTQSNIKMIPSYRSLDIPFTKEEIWPQSPEMEWWNDLLQREESFINFGEWIIFHGCYNKLLQAYLPKVTQIYYLRIMWVRSLTQVPPE